MVKTATSQNGDTKTATEMAESKRRQTKTATSQNGDKLRDVALQFISVYITLYRIIFYV